jgi:O-antigen ligase
VSVENKASGSWLPWAFVAIAAGALAGVAAVASPRDAAMVTVALALSVPATVAVFRRPEHGIVLMLLALPLDIAGRIVAEPVAVTVYHLALLLMLAAWAWAWLRDPAGWRPRFSALDVGIAALVAAALWSLPGSLDRSATVVAIIRLAFLWLFSLSVVTFVRDGKAAGRLIAVLVSTAALSSVLAFAQYTLPGLTLGSTHLDMDQGVVVRVRPSAFFDDPNLLGTMLSLAVIAALGMAVHAKRWTHAFGWLVLAGVCSGGLLVTLSRTAWFGVVLGVVILILTAPGRRRVWLAGASLTIAVAGMLLAPGAIVSRAASIVDIQRDSSIRTRYLMAGSTLEMIEDDWVYGTGLAAYGKAYPAYRRVGAIESITLPHQLPLAMWAEMGVPGLIAELLIVGAIVYVMRHRRHKRWNVYESIGVAGLLAALLQSLFQYYLYFEYLWLFLALTVAATRFANNHKEVDPCPQT